MDFEIFLCETWDVGSNNHLVLVLLYIHSHRLQQQCLSRQPIFKIGSGKSAATLEEMKCKLLDFLVNPAHLLRKAVRNGYGKSLVLGFNRCHDCGRHRDSPW